MVKVTMTRGLLQPPMGARQRGGPRSTATAIAGPGLGTQGAQSREANGVARDQRVTHHEATAYLRQGGNSSEAGVQLETLLLLLLLLRQTLQSLYRTNLL